MGKKGKKSRFNQVLDIDITYSRNSVLDASSADPPELMLSEEKLAELKRVRAQLPSAPQAVRMEEDIARIPDSGPFRLVLVNVAFSATREDIEEFLLPIVPTHIKLVEEDGRFRGFCFVDFASKADLAAVLLKNNPFILNRRVTMRIADQHNDGDSRGGGGFNRRQYGDRHEGGWNSNRSDYNRRDGGGFGERAEPSGWTRRNVKPTGPPGRPSDFSRGPPPSGFNRQPAAPGGPLPERPIIRIAPRSTNTGAAVANDSAAVSARHASIFGAAKPVDTGLRTAEASQSGSEPPRGNAWSRPLA